MAKGNGRRKKPRCEKEGHDQSSEGASILGVIEEEERASARVMPGQPWPSDASEQISVSRSDQGASIVGLISDRMTRIAQANPRNEPQVLAKALEQLRYAPEMAKKAWYSIPYKNHKRGCQDRKNCDCQKTYVQGLSIRAAEDLVGYWGNAALRSYVADETESMVRVVGVFVDLEKNVWKERDFVAGKSEQRGGYVVKLSGRDLDMAIQRATSKAQRNAALAGLPTYLKTRYWDKARAIDASHETRKAGGHSAAIVRMLEAFEAVGVTAEMIEKHLGHALSSITKEEAMDLRGIHNAIISGEAKAHDLFGVSSTTESTISPEDFAEAEVEATEKA